MYKKMWEELKQYIETYENEITYIMQQIEEEYFKKEDVIDELIKEVSKWKTHYKCIETTYML